MSAEEGGSMIGPHEIGRMSEQMRNLTNAVGKLDQTVGGMSRHFATQRDLDRVEEMAAAGKVGSERANTRLDSFSTWEKIAAAVMAAIIIYVVKMG